MSTPTCPVTTALQCKKRTLAPVMTQGLQTKLYSSINDIPRADWQQILQPDDLFMSVDYWKAFEASVSSNVGFRYLVFHYKNEVAGIAAFQIIQFNASNIGTEADVQQMSWSKKLLTKALKPLSFRLLVCGNTFMTGNYGLRFSNGDIDHEHAQWLLNGIQQIEDEERAKGKAISGVLVKDFYQHEAKGLDQLEGSGYLKFLAQPNMVLNIDPAWKDFKGYLSAMSSKYRTRVKRALKDMKGITIRPLVAEEIDQYMPRIEDLYQQVIGQSSFKLATFDIAHLKPMKGTFGSCLHCDGFFLDGELIGFTSLIEHENELAAGMLGLNKDLQRDHDLYFNMLIHIVKRGIEHKADRIVMGRTAMEIKSSLGAVPMDMDVYARHTSNWKNFFVKKIVSFMTRPEEWHQRHPFKKGDDN